MIRVGIIGLGEVSQLMHLPILTDLVYDYKVTAISDVSQSLLDFVADKYQIGEKYLSAVDLIESENVDAVFILSPDQYHGIYMKEAIKKGKHVFVEKPVTLCSYDLNEVIELKKEHRDIVVMVGYMRRYTQTYLKAKQLLSEYNKPIEYLRMRDNILEGHFYIGQTRPIFYPKDIPENKITESGNLKDEQLRKALGDNASETQKKAYTMLTGLGSHTLSAVREIIGIPKKINSVSSNFRGEQLVVVFEYESFMAIYELVNNQNFVEFDASIEFFQNHRKTKIKYETPYIRYQPLYLEVIDSSKTESKTTHYGPYYNDPFQTELVEFAKCIKENRCPKTTLEDSIMDLKLFEDIVKHIGE